MKLWADILDPALSEKFVKVPRRVWLSQLSLDARAVYQTLLLFAWDDPVTYPGGASIVAAIGISHNRVTAAKRELVEAKLISITRRGQGHSDLYRFLPLASAVLKSRIDNSRINESLIQESTNRQSTLDTGDIDTEDVDQKHVSLLFDQFWQTYPPRNGKKREKSKARDAFARLSNFQQRAAILSASNYAAACKSGKEIAKDAFRWLRSKDEIKDWMTPADIQPRNGDDAPARAPGEVGRGPQREFVHDPAAFAAGAKPEDWDEKMRKMGLK